MCASLLLISLWGSYLHQIVTVWYNYIISTGTLSLHFSLPMALISGLICNINEQQVLNQCFFRFCNLLSKWWVNHRINRSQIEKMIIIALLSAQDGFGHLNLRHGWRLTIDPGRQLGNAAALGREFHDILLKGQACCQLIAAVVTSMDL